MCPQGPGQVALESMLCTYTEAAGLLCGTMSERKAVGQNRQKRSFSSETRKWSQTGGR